MKNYELSDSTGKEPDHEISYSWNSLSKYRDEENPNLWNKKAETVDDLRQMKTADQLARLSSMIEEAEADSKYAYFKAYNIFETIEKDDSFSALIRIVAGVGKSMDTTDERYDNDVYAKIRGGEEEFGYSTIVRPEMNPEGCLSPEIAMMNEGEIRSEIKRINNVLAEPMPFDSKAEYQISYANELELALNKKIFARNQARLHEEFPSLPENKQLVKIASDAAAAVDFVAKFDEREDAFSSSVLISEVVNEKGEKVDFENDMSTYLSSVHQNDIVKNAIEKELGIKLVDIPIESQVALLKFMTEAGNDRFYKLRDALHATDKELRLKIANNFLAADFGDDFGDSLLNIVDSERLSDNDKEKLLDQISSCRESIRKITDLYGEVDSGEFAKEYSRASNERLTDAIAIFEKIAGSDNGSVEVNLGQPWPGKVKFDFESAYEALDYEAKSLKIIGGILNDIQKQKDGAFAEIVLHSDSSEQRLQRTMYNLYSPDYGYALLYTRPEGSHTFDPMLEYGKVRNKYDRGSVNAGVEASISFITNPVDPFSLPNPYRPNRFALKNPHYYDPAYMDKVSAIRLDREGRAPGTAANDANRDPISPNGIVSVDLAAIGDRADTPSGKIARLMSAGNRLRADKMKLGDEGVSLNHNTRYFDQSRYGTADGFADIVRYLDNKMSEYATNCPPAANAESFTRQMRQNSRKRGGRAMGSMFGLGLAT